MNLEDTLINGGAFWVMQKEHNKAGILEQAADLYGPYFTIYGWTLRLTL